MSKSSTKWISSYKIIMSKNLGGNHISNMHKSFLTNNFKVGMSPGSTTFIHIFWKHLRNCIITSWGLSSSMFFTHVGCQCDNTSHTCLFRRLLLEKYFLKYSHKSPKTNLQKFQKNLYIIMSRFMQKTSRKNFKIFETHLQVPFVFKSKHYNA
jgi:hypothetical protein